MILLLIHSRKAVKYKSRSGIPLRLLSCVIFVSTQTTVTSIMSDVWAHWNACFPVWRCYAVSKHEISSCKRPIIRTTHTIDHKIPVCELTQYFRSFPGWFSFVLWKCTHHFTMFQLIHQPKRITLTCIACLCLVELAGDNSRNQVKEGMSHCIDLKLLHLDDSLIMCLIQENYCHYHCLLHVWS